MEECKADKGSCVVGNAIVGMVISARAARACDVCGKERARWYCAADSAYLCERCDGIVHSANAVAGRHERVRLGSNGAPLKIARTPAASLKREHATAAAPFPAAHLNPRKKPRSIRRHKPSSFLASKHGISSIQASNYINNSSSNFNNSLIYAPNHSIMINNPRNDLDFIANSNIDLNNKFVVKAEPYSPIDIGDQVKVPDHTDDDPLFESLFDFRDLQDDDLFLHQVPIYNPLQNQDHKPPTVDSKPYADYEEIKPIIINTPNEESRELALSKSSCAAIHPSELAQAELDSNSLSLGRDVEDNEGLSIAKCEEPDDRFIDSGNGLCDLDQLDFDSMLHGHDDEDGDEESHANNMSALHVHANSHDYMDASNCHFTGDDSGSYAEDSCAHHGNGMDDDDIDDSYEVDHAGYGETFDFDTTGSESPRTWLCKVKVESPPQLMQVNSGHADALLREKLTCKIDSQSGFKLGLKLNFEDVVHAWSDRGTFWMDGHPPHQLNNCLDFLGGWLVPDMSSTSTTEGDGQQLVPVLNYKSKKGDGSAREASVLRYREKRRTRLFSKKIRYEVRKLNAEKRPRMKGRFVKRISTVG